MVVMLVMIVMVVMLMMLELLTLVLLFWYGDAAGDLGDVVFVGDCGLTSGYNVFINSGNYVGVVGAVLVCCVVVKSVLTDALSTVTNC
jgi:hypothetical protein